MPWEVSLFPVNNYVPGELLQELPPEEYLFDAAGNLIFAQAFFNSETGVGQLIQFLFQTKEIPPEVYRNGENYILDLSALKNNLIQFEQLELLYPNWLQLTGRQNNMDEFGMLIDFIAFGRNVNRSRLLLVVCKRTK